MRHARFVLAALLANLAFAPQARAAESFDNCVGFIESLPATISTQGTWCLRKDLATGQTSGAAITVNANNVILDCNHFKLGGLAGGPNTNAFGIGAFDRTNTVVRQCNIRGFSEAVIITGNGATVEANRLEGNTGTGIWLQGHNHMVRGNIIAGTGGRNPQTDAIYVVGYGGIGGVDVVDNIIDGVAPLAGTDSVATGIRVAVVGHVEVRGNRVRGLVAQGGEYGILISPGAPGATSITGNQVMGRGTPNGIGIACPPADGYHRVASGNVVNGFETALLECTNGGNSL